MHMQDIMSNFLVLKANSNNQYQQCTYSNTLKPPFSHIVVWQQPGSAQFCNGLLQLRRTLISCI